jgi:hypothetical protein
MGVVLATVVIACRRMTQKSLSMSFFTRELVYALM